jgi:flagellar FliL protein
MASSEATTEVLAAPAQAASRPGIVQLLMVMVVTVAISVLLMGGGIYYLLKSGKVSLPGAAPVAAVKKEAEPVLSSHLMVLEPIVVNLADEGGKNYLRITVSLRVLDSDLKKEEKPKAAKGPSEAEAAVRDTALEVLGRQTAEGLLMPEGKERLKVELKAAIALHNPDVKIADLYFTEFLVQR